jgi:hypothetical protein
MAHDAYLIEDKKLVIFWSRKAGNTSLAEWLVDVVTPETTGPFARPARRTVDRYLPSVEAREAMTLVREKGYQDFVLARNPYRRAISAYVEKFCFYGDRRMQGLDDLKGFARKLFLQVMQSQGKPADASAYEGEAYQGLSFVDFLQAIVHHVRNPGRLGEPALNGHWAPQVPFLFRQEGFRYSNVIRLEHAREEIAPLAIALNTDIAFPHTRKNATDGVQTVSDRDLSRVPSAQLAREGLMPTSKALLNDETIALMREAFALDFEMLGYSPDDVPA